MNEKVDRQDLAFHTVGNREADIIRDIFSWNADPAAIGRVDSQQAILGLPARIYSVRPDVVIDV